MLRPTASPAIDSGQARPDPAPPPPLVGVIALLLIATAMGSNHVAGRLAFDHGTSVPLAVVTRAGVTALLMALLVRQAGLSLALPRMTLAGAAAAGLLMSLQSLCLTSAVARMPVALALLVFNTFGLSTVSTGLVLGGTAALMTVLRLDRHLNTALFSSAIAFSGYGPLVAWYIPNRWLDYLMGSLRALAAALWLPPKATSCCAAPRQGPPPDALTRSCWRVTRFLRTRPMTSSSA